LKRTCGCQRADDERLFYNGLRGLSDLLVKNRQETAKGVELRQDEAPGAREEINKKIVIAGPS